MKLNPVNMGMIEFFHQLKFDKININETTRQCLKEIYDVYKQSPTYRFTNNVNEGIVFTTNGIIQPVEESEYFPREIAHYIQSHKKQQFLYEVIQDRRHIFIHFILFESPVRKKYDEYAQLILRVLFTLNHFSHKNCAKSKEFHIYIYMTPFMKFLPLTEVIGASSVNTGVNKKDWKCSNHEEVNEIVIFRKEDWFKVLIHESIHSFRLDFTHAAKKEIRDLFPVNSEVNLFEAYTEFWAKMINMLICSIFLEKRNNFDKVMEIMNLLIQTDIKFSLFQVIKVLRFMDLTYIDLVNRRNIERYREETNVFSYFVLNLCLMTHYNLFIECCKKNSHNILNFNEEKINYLVHFIKTWYKNPKLLENIQKMEEIFVKTKNKNLLKNMKMTLFEII
jgi:hypothetical protein